MEVELGRRLEMGRVKEEIAGRLAEQWQHKLLWKGSEALTNLLPVQNESSSSPVR
jgi:hypothetical protein